MWNSKMKLALGAEGEKKLKIALFFCAYLDDYGVSHDEASFHMGVSVETIRSYIGDPAPGLPNKRIKKKDMARAILDQEPIPEKLFKKLISKVSPLKNIKEDYALFLSGYGGPH